jgi:DNA invertase Pin-like site-specific DNA recombinase
MDGKFIPYYRVSTARQGLSGLGLEDQRQAVNSHLNGGNWRVVKSFTEIESGKNSARPELQKALALCKLTGATLIVAKLDRLARDQSFLMSIVEGSGSGGVTFCDLPNVPPGPVGKFLVQQMAAVAELEAGLISARTKAALAQSTKKLGGWRGGPMSDAAAARAARTAKANQFAASVEPMIREMQGEGKSLRTIATELQERGIRTPRGGSWSAVAVQRILARVAA